MAQKTTGVNQPQRRRVKGKLASVLANFPLEVIFEVNTLLVLDHTRSNAFYTD